MKKAALALLCFASFVPSFALARHGRADPPPSAPPRLETHGKAIVNAACSFSGSFGLGTCSPLVRVPDPAPTWLTSPCFFLTDVTASNLGSAGTDILTLIDGTSAANTKLVLNVAQGATVVQDLQSPVYFSSGLTIADSNATNNEVVAVSGYWGNCPTR